MGNQMSFAPDWSSHPGQTICQVLREKQLSRSELAGGLGKSVVFVNSLIDGNERVTPALAAALAKTIGASERFWLTRSDRYFCFQEEKAHLQKLNQALAKFPFSEIKRFGWLTSKQLAADKLSAMLDFFRVSSPVELIKVLDGNAIEARFKQAGERNLEFIPLLTWLKYGETIARQTEVVEWDKGLFRAALPTIKALTRKTDPSVFVPELKRICAGAGVGVVVSPAPRGCNTYGATFFTKDRRAVILLSGRQLTDDHFWFTFFHEAGHLILHSQDRLFLETEEGIVSSEEAEANQFATQELIGELLYKELESLDCDAPAQVLRFAKKSGVSPGVVVGQLQHRGLIPFGHYNRYKARYKWIQLESGVSLGKL